ncbi:MAG: hypothetical protein RMK74_01180 [Myxococcales bacterium]|nr:hypothetical protein [Myxococcales bacterium]
MSGAFDGEARLGLIGPAHDDDASVHAAIRTLIARAAHVVYLGDDEAARRAARRWAEELAPGLATEDRWVDEAARLAATGSAAQLEALLERRRALAPLYRVRELPPGRGRAIEIIAGRIVTLVHDKAWLDEDDVANSTLLVYGRSDEPVLRRFGPRWFFTPGPLRLGRIGLVEADASGQLGLELLEVGGQTLWREQCATGPQARMSVQP